MKKFFSLLAAVLFAGSMMATEVTVSKTVAELATANSWENGNVVTPFALDEVITVSTDATDANTGKYYTSGQQVRLYQTGGAKLIISAAEGYSISSITLTYVSYNTGILLEAESGVAVDFVNAQSATFTVGNSGDASNGQARITAIAVTYDGEGGEVPPVTLEDGYYLVGSMTNWEPTNYIFSLNEGAEGVEYMFDLDMNANDEFKVRQVENGVATTWFPEAQEGDNKNYVVAEDGSYTIYFRPNYDGNEDWHEGCINVMPKEMPVLEPISCAQVRALDKGAELALNDVIVTFSNDRNVWVRDETGSMLLFLPKEYDNRFQAGDKLSGIEGKVDIYQSVIYEVVMTAEQADAVEAIPGDALEPEELAYLTAEDVSKFVILRGVEAEGEFTSAKKSDIKAMWGKAEVTLYNQFSMDFTFEADKLYDVIGIVSAYKGNVQLYFIYAEEAAGLRDGYYLVGNMNEWAPMSGFLFEENEEAEGEEYMLLMQFEAGDEFKVLQVADGEATDNWFPGGQGNNCTINEAGIYVVYFRPNADGGEDWFNGVILNQKVDTTTIVMTDGQVAVGFDDNNMPLALVELFNFAEWDEEGYPLGDGDWLTLYVFPESIEMLDGIYSYSANNLMGEMYRVAGEEETEASIVGGEASLEILSVDLINQSAQIRVVATVVCDNNAIYMIEAELEVYYEMVEPIGPTEGVMNAEVGTKAIKRVEMGNVVIYKNGVKYNINGAVVR